jgi:hypothetical protein
MLRFCFILLFPFALSAQDSIRNEWCLGFRPKTGFLAAHRGTMGHLPKDRIFCGEISLGKRLYGENNWNSAYRNPIVGLTLYGSNLGNKEYLGYGFGAYSFIEFPMVENTDSYLSWKMGVGLGYVTKVFDQELNPKNDATSTHMNALLCLGVTGKWRFAKDYSLLYGIDLTHFSNGSTRMPNLGLNIPTLSLGVAYHWKGKNLPGVEQKVFTKTPFFTNWNWTNVAIISSKEAFPTGGRNYPVYALNSFVWKQFKAKVGMEVGLDFISKQSLMKYREYIPKTQWTIFQIGAYTSYILPLDRLRFIVGMGVYLKDRYDMDNEIYHRVGMRYECENGLLFNLVLKTHWAKADYVEYGVGYTFKHKKK